VITFVKIGLGAAIAIIFPIMVGLGTEAFFPSPRPSNECQSIMEREDQKELSESEKAALDKCEAEFMDDMETYNRNIFIPLTIIGFITLAAGALFLSEAAGPVAPGLVFGGLLTIMYTTMRGFTAVDKRWLFLELVIVLAGLILVTLRYVKQTAKK
jgi:hypothetical protein